MKALFFNYWRRLLTLIAWTATLGSFAHPAGAAEGGWLITQTSIQNGWMPSINNSGEIVYFLNSGAGVYSTTRGKLANGGLFPRLANSGEVVYADSYGGSTWDLVSTTRGRLTYGGIINVNQSYFDVNSSGEVVYASLDGSGRQQIYSTVRGQLTFDSEYHYNPCINDSGEIVWGQYIAALGGSRTVSTTRGILPENYGFAPLKLNNLGDICSSGNIENSFPHVFSSVYGAIINDAAHFQWGGSVNDAGVYVWQGEYTGSPLTIFQAVWIVPEPSVASLLALPVLFWCCRRVSNKRG